MSAEQTTPIFNQCFHAEHGFKIVFPGIRSPKTVNRKYSPCIPFCSLECGVPYFSGHYLLAQPEFNTRAVLVSPAVIPGMAPFCLEFSYSMYGSDVGILSVVLADSDGEHSQVWLRVGDQGVNWRKAFLPLPRLPFTVSSISFKIGPWEMGQ